MGLRVLRRRHLLLPRHLPGDATGPADHGHQPGGGAGGPTRRHPDGGGHRLRRDQPPRPRRAGDVRLQLHLRPGDRRQRLRSRPRLLRPGQLGQRCDGLGTAVEHGSLRGAEGNPVARHPCDGNHRRDHRQRPWSGGLAAGGDSDAARAGYLRSGHLRRYRCRDVVGCRRNSSRRAGQSEPCPCGEHVPWRQYRLLPAVLAGRDQLWHCPRHCVRGRRRKQQW